MARTVTAIKVQKRRRNRVNVYLDGDFAFGLQDILGARLRVGQSLEDPEIAALREEDDAERAYSRALHYLSYRPRSEREVSNYLAGKEYAEPAIEAALARLRRVHLVDDQDFARRWVDNRERLNPKGPWVLRGELRRKGIADAIIDEVLEDLDEEASALKASQKGARRLSGRDETTFRRRLTAYLQRRGFDYDTCRQIVDRRWREEQVQQDG
jgi:regulatory protein